MVLIKGIVKWGGRYFIYVMTGTKMTGWLERKQNRKYGQRTHMYVVLVNSNILEKSLASEVCFLLMGLIGDFL